MRNFLRSAWWWIRLMARIVPVTVEALPAQVEAQVKQIEGLSKSLSERYQEMYALREELNRARKVLNEQAAEIAVLKARLKPGGFRVRQEKRVS